MSMFERKSATRVLYWVPSSIMASTVSIPLNAALKANWHPTILVVSWQARLFSYSPKLQLEKADVFQFAGLHRKLEGSDILFIATGSRPSFDPLGPFNVDFQVNTLTMPGFAEPNRPLSTHKYYINLPESWHFLHLILRSAVKWSLELTCSVLSNDIDAPNAELILSCFREQSILSQQQNNRWHLQLAQFKCLFCNQQIWQHALQDSCERLKVSLACREFPRLCWSPQ